MVGGNGMDDNPVQVMLFPRDKFHPTSGADAGLFQLMLASFGGGETTPGLFAAITATRRGSDDRCAHGTGQSSQLDVFGGDRRQRQAL